MKSKKPKVVVAMSGGVDSSVVAALLKQQGYDVVGVFMQFWYPTGEKYGENRCCSLESWHEAMEVARILDIPIHKVNFGRQFKKLIVDEFLQEYKSGHTPNPCVACNKFIKFDLLLKYAKTVFNADFLATGHYIRLQWKFSIFNFQFSNKSKIQNTKNKSDVIELFRAKDLNKDQTYFLYNLKQSQLKHLLFPLADYTKDQVRKLAKKFKLPVHDKPDSQEVCFVGASHNDFLKKYLKLKPGKIVTFDFSPLPSFLPPLTKGRVGVGLRGWELGKHEGLQLYTIGQRSGIGLSGGPWYVEKLDFKKNILIVTKKQENSQIFSNELKCHKASWILNNPIFPLKCQAQIRYHGQTVACQVDKKGAYLTVKFNKKQRAITSGQSVVFYSGKRLLGGAIIG